MILLPVLWAAFFFLLIPLVGAVVVLRRWRRFRARLVESSLFPLADYKILRNPAYASRYRFVGRLEALEDQHFLWLREEGGSASVKVDMRGQDFWVFPESEALLKDLSPDEKPFHVPDPPQRFPWYQAGAMVEGAQFFVYGPLVQEETQGVFRSQPGRELLVIQFLTQPQHLLTQTVWTGRQQNEYWNGITPLAFAVGIVGLLALAYFWYRQPGFRLSALVSFALALLPLTIFLPPGMIFFRLFNRIWAKARWFRAFRDMVLLPFRYWGMVPGDLSQPLDTKLPNGGVYRCTPEGPDWNPGSSDYLLIRWKRFTGGTQYYLRPEGAESFFSPVLLRGDPMKMHRGAIKKARRGELLALLCFLAGVGTNLLLLLVILFRTLG